MRLCYVAGPYRHATVAGVANNIARAADVGKEVAKLGVMPVVPHLLTVHGIADATNDEAFWLAGTMRVLQVCDVVVLVEGWESSNGTKAEIAEARALGIPVFESIGALRAVEVPTKKRRRTNG